MSPRVGDRVGARLVARRNQQLQHRFVQPLLPQLRLVQLRRPRQELHEELVYGLHAPVGEPAQPRHVRRPQRVRKVLAQARDRERRCALVGARLDQVEERLRRHLPRVREGPLRERVHGRALRGLRGAPPLLPPHRRGLPDHVLHDVERLEGRVRRHAREHLRRQHRVQPRHRHPEPAQVPPRAFSQVDQRPARHVAALPPPVPLAPLDVEPRRQRREHLEVVRALGALVDPLQPAEEPVRERRLRGEPQQRRARRLRPSIEQRDEQLREREPRRRRRIRLREEPLPRGRSGLAPGARRAQGGSLLELRDERIERQRPLAERRFLLRIGLLDERLHDVREVRRVGCGQPFDIRDLHRPCLHCRPQAPAALAASAIRAARRSSPRASSDPRCLRGVELRRARCACK